MFNSIRLVYILVLILMYILISCRQITPVYQTNITFTPESKNNIGNLVKITATVTPNRNITKIVPVSTPTQKMLKSATVQSLPNVTPTYSIIVQSSAIEDEEENNPKRETGDSIPSNVIPTTVNRISFGQGNLLFNKTIYDYTTYKNISTVLSTTDNMVQKGYFFPPDDIFFGSAIWSNSCEKIAADIFSQDYKMSGVAIIDIHTGQQEDIIWGTARYHEPDWSSDNLKIVVGVFTDTIGFQIQIVTLHNLAAKQITSIGDNWNPVWAPTKDIIAFTSSRDQSDPLRSSIYLMNPDGSEQRLLVPLYWGAETSDNYQRFDARQPRWSPDGSKIAFTVTETFNDMEASRIYLTDITGTSITNATYNDKSNLNLYFNLQERDPIWSPDGNKLLFKRNDQWCTINITDQSEECWDTPENTAYLDWCQ